MIHISSYYNMEDSANSKTQSPSLFNKNIATQTSEYIRNTFIEVPQQLERLNLSELCMKVAEELTAVQGQACEDYVGVKEEIVELGSQLSVADHIMNELQQTLFVFKGNLEAIKDDMSLLQQKSAQMATSLNNKKNVQHLLTSFVQSAVLDNELKEAILSAPINQNYTQYIRQLIKKFNYFNSNLITPDTKAIKELQPQLQKLKAKASIRIRQFLLQQISLLKKPKTSIQKLQKNTLGKYNVFGQFLRQHNTQIYAQLCNTYRQTMAKVYSNNYKIYLSQIQKLQIDLYVKADHLIPSETQNMRPLLTTKHTSLAQEGRSIFYLMNRDLIIAQHDGVDMIQYQSNGPNSRKFTLQQTFKAANRCLINEVVHQIIFTAQFFSLKSSGAIQIFAPLFAPSAQYFLQFLKKSVAHTYDIYAVLVMLAINEKNKENLEQIGCNALDHYFSQVAMVLWPKFQYLFDLHLKSIQSCSVNHFRRLERHFGQTLIDRFVDYIVALYRLYIYFQNSTVMFEKRLQALRRAFFQLISKVFSQNEKQNQNTNNCVRILQKIHQTCTNDATVSNFKQFHLYQQDLQKEIEVYCSKLISTSIKEFFPHLNNFIQKYYKAPSASEEPTIFIGQNIEARILEETVAQICPPSLGNKMSKIFALAQKNHSGYSLKLLQKSTTNIFIRYYSDIYKYCKQNYNELGSTMQQTHLIIKQLKNIVQ